MPSTAARVKEHQERWDKLVRDPSLRDLLYKVEPNATGQIVVTPHKAERSDLQEDIQDLPRTHAPNNRRANIKEKIELYLAAGAEEVWVVDAERHVWFFGEEEMEASALIPSVPTEL